MKINVENKIYINAGALLIILSFIFLISTISKLQNYANNQALINKQYFVFEEFLSQVKRIRLGTILISNDQVIKGVIEARIGISNLDKIEKEAKELKFYKINEIYPYKERLISHFNTYFRIVNSSDYSFESKKLYIESLLLSIQGIGDEIDLIHNQFENKMTSDLEELHVQRSILEIRAKVFTFLGIFSILLTVAVIYYTQKKELDLIVENHKKELLLEQSSKFATIGEMTSGLAHEINNPLIVIQGYIEMLGHDLKSNKISEEIYKTSIDKVLFNIEKIDSLVMKVKKLGHQKSFDSFENVNIRALFLELTEIYDKERVNKNVKVDFILPSEDLIANSKRKELVQVIINLINNSIDAVEKHESPWVRVEAEYSDGKVLIYVIDSGNGIDKKIQNKIMNPFFTTKDIGKGSGLGLSISEKLIKEQFGTLEYSKNSTNTTFVITLNTKNYD